jgi:hypothetical protein
MKKIAAAALPALALVLTVALAASLYFAYFFYQQALQQNHLIAASWGDGKFGKAFYGARVYYVPEGQQVRVWLAVQIDRGSVWTQYSHNPRLLGTAGSASEAVAKWGQLNWTERGLQVGSSAGSSYLFPTAELENHR